MASRMAGVTTEALFPIPFEDVGDEERHVFQTLPQGGDFEADARQTEIQIQPERARLDQIQQLFSVKFLIALVAH